MSRLSPSRPAVTAGALAALTTLALIGGTPATAAATGTGTATAGRDAVQKELDKLVGKHGFPGALAAVRGRDGRVRHYTAGVGDLKTKAKVPVDGYVRIGSNTKTYVAVVVLQLAGEGKLDLDAPVEDYLPGLVRGKGNDGRKITIRMLLNHTSGLPNYTEYLPLADLQGLRYRSVRPERLVELALAHKRKFAPGKGWEYSNTGYILLGMAVEKVTGRSIRAEVADRIIKPLGLKHTYWPGVGVQTIRDPHPKGYHFLKPGKPLDVTRLDPSWGGAAGQLIATPSDLNRFFRALLDGELLKPELLKEMQTTVKPKNFIPGVEYGLGVVKFKLSCGGHAWGHGGDIHGYETRNAATRDGRAAAVAVTALPWKSGDVFTAVDRALCAKS